jgi:hypothetical protein
MVAHTYNCSTPEAEVGGLWVLCQTEPHSKTLYFSFYSIFCFFFWYCGLKLGPTPWATPLALFCESPFGFFKIGSLELFPQAGLQTAILLISASWVARITGVSHPCLADPILNKQMKKNEWLSAPTHSHIPFLVLFSTICSRCSLEDRG